MIVSILFYTATDSIKSIKHSQNVEHLGGAG